MKTHLILTASLLIWASSATHLFANGGGYSGGGMTSAGDLLGFEPKATENVRILDELLTVKLGPNSARVEVRYRMRNELAKRVKVRFGFPVEEVGRGELVGTLEDTESQPRHEKLIYCQSYQISANGQALAATWEAEQRGEDDRRFRHLAGWLVSELNFARNEEKELRISFDSVYSKDVSWVSENSHTARSVFKYRLSTAACWAGTIGKGRIVLEPSGIAPEELRVIKPVNRFRKEGAHWVWEFTDLEPTLADDIEIEAQPAVASYARRDDEGDTATYESRGERWTLVHSNYEIRASSTLPPEGEITYEADNLKQMWQGAWAEGAEGPGVGEWLEVKPVVSKPLVAISFAAGLDGENEIHYTNNARPRKVRLELNGGEHTAVLGVPDSPEDYRHAITGYDKPVETIRLTFEEVWPGTKFEDLCLRKLRLHVALDQKPEIQPSR